jgi:hypothetical protein
VRRRAKPQARHRHLTTNSWSATDLFELGDAAQQIFDGLLAAGTVIVRLKSVRRDAA